MFLAVTTFMKTKTFLFALVSLTVSFSSASSSTGEDPLEFLKTVTVPEGVHNEMYKYFAKEDPSNKQVNAYIANFIPNFHDQMVDETENYFQQHSGANGCKPSFEASFPDQLTTGYNFESKQDFEGNFLKVESNACLGKLNIEKVFETLMSENFQRRVIDGFETISFPSSSRTCVSTSTTFLSTNYCVTKQILKNKTQIVIQSFNDANKAGADPIYFKDTINIITQLPNGDVSFYNLMYARGKDISGLVKGGVRSSAKGTYERVRDNLIELSH